MAIGNTQGSRGFIFILLIGKQARTTSLSALVPRRLFVQQKHSYEYGVVDENAGSGRLPHGCNLVPRQMGNGHTFTAPIPSTSDRAKPSASSWNVGISIRIIAITHDARWEGA